LQREGFVEDLGRQVKRAIVDVVGCVGWDLDLGALALVTDCGEVGVSTKEVRGRGVPKGDGEAGEGGVPGCGGHVEVEGCAGGGEGDVGDPVGVRKGLRRKEGIYTCRLRVHRLGYSSHGT
jgi:hypothetical protein